MERDPTGGYLAILAAASASSGESDQLFIQVLQGTLVCTLVANVWEDDAHGPAVHDSLNEAITTLVRDPHDGGDAEGESAGTQETGV